MPTKQQDEPFKEQQARERQPSVGEIGKHVLSTLGRPAGLYRVQVRPLWPDHYRVNVFVGDATSARLAHSYFLVADSEGNVVESTPRITRQY